MSHFTERQAAVAALLADHRWHDTVSICRPEVGGSEGTRRLRELREGGWRIVKRRKAESEQFEYRLKTADEP